LAWTLVDPAVTAPIFGALEEASAIELGFPHDFLARPMTRSVMFGDVKIAARP
jgi:hypothetical protein